MLPSRIFFDDFFGDEPTKIDKLMKCDIYEKDNTTFIEMDMPGVKKEELNLDIEKGYLTIAYSSKIDEDRDDERKYIRRERHVVTSSQRRFYVGDVVEEDIKAEFKDGILTIKVPMEQSVPTKKTINID